MPGKQLPPGDHERTLEVGDSERSYLLHVPASARDGSPPLVVVLHGGDRNSLLPIASVGFTQLADDEGFVVAYPSALVANWNDGREGDFSPEHRDDTDDVGFLGSVVCDVDSLVGIDGARVYFVGVSNGGMMTHRMACERPDLVAAAAMVIAGAPAAMLDCADGPPVAMVTVPGTDDPIMPYDGGQVMGDRGEVIGAAETVRFWAARNGCDAEPVVVERQPVCADDPTRVVEHRFGGCDDGVGVVMYEIRGGGHTWPGWVQYLPVDLIGATNDQMNASSEIWTFLSAHSR